MPEIGGGTFWAHANPVVGRQPDCGWTGSRIDPFYKRQRRRGACQSTTLVWRPGRFTNAGFNRPSRRWTPLSDPRMVVARLHNWSLSSCAKGVTRRLHQLEHFLAALAFRRRSWDRCRPSLPRRYHTISYLPSWCCSWREAPVESGPFLDCSHREP